MAAVMDDLCMLLRIESLALVWMVLHGWPAATKRPRIESRLAPSGASLATRVGLRSPGIWSAPRPIGAGTAIILAPRGGSGHEASAGERPSQGLESLPEVLAAIETLEGLLVAQATAAYLQTALTIRAQLEVNSRSGLRCSFYPGTPIVNLTICSTCCS